MKQVLHSGDLICEGIIKQQAEPAKVEEPKKEEPAAQGPAAAPAQPVPNAGVTANVAVISVSHPAPATCSLHTRVCAAECFVTGKARLALLRWLNHDATQTALRSLPSRAG